MLTCFLSIIVPYTQQVQNTHSFHIHTEFNGKSMKYTWKISVKFQKNEILPNIVSDHNRIKLKTKNSKITGKVPDTEKLIVVKTEQTKNAKSLRFKKSDKSGLGWDKRTRVL